jgi:hypothetical protein
MKVAKLSMCLLATSAPTESASANHYEEHCSEKDGGKMAEILPILGRVLLPDP